MAFAGCCFSTRAAYTNKHVSGVLGRFKCKVVLKSHAVNLIRYKHVSFGASEKLCSRQASYMHRVLDCEKCSHRTAFGVAFVRAASTGAFSEVRFLHADGFVASCQANNLGDATLPGQLTANASAAATEANNILESNATASDAITSIGSIPEPPALPPEAIDILQEVGEPSFVSLGLGGWSPVGMVQTAFEHLHIGYDIPWWGTIVIGTIVARTLMFPLVILSQKNAAKMANNLPQLQLLQLKMSEARQMGNQLEAARYAQEMVLFMKEKQLNPLRNVIVPLAQAPLFISFFMALRGMTNVPVESMRTGGLYWFTDLTVPDQYYLMPIITSATLWITIEVGADSGKLSQSNMQLMRYVLRALPVVILPFTVNFPGAILVYWCSTNFISLIQVGFLRIPAVREYFKIERTVKFDPDQLPVKQKGFIKGLKESWTNMRISKELEDRQRLDELQFNRAGKGPIQKTYKYNPTKMQPVHSAKETLAAKKRDT